MIFVYKNGIRGGITRAFCHYVKANNKYLHDYNKTKGTTYIKYLDFKNQCRWALK